jgi:antitoxin CptB
MRFAPSCSLHAQPPEESSGTAGGGTAHNGALHQSDPLRRARLRWRARRGLLENDLIFERFFSRYEDSLSDNDVGVLTRLFELSDNDLMDLLLARKEPEGDLSDPDVLRVLGLLRAV